MVSLFQRIRKVLTFKQVHVREVGDVSVGSALEISDNDEGYTRAYRNNPHVRRCVDLRARLIASTPLRLYKRLPQGRELIPKHDVISLLQDVNPYNLNRSTLWYETEVDTCVYGRAWWLLDRPAISRERVNVAPPKGIYHLLAKNIPQTDQNPKLDDSPGGPGWIKHVVFKVQGQEDRAYDINQLIYFRRANPSNSVHGLSPLSSVIYEIEAYQQAVAWNAKFFKNGARLSGWLELPGDMTDGERENAIESFRKAYASGVDTAHKVGLLEGGARFVTDGTTPRDSDWANLCQRSKETVYNLYGVPLAFSRGSLDKVAAAARDSGVDFWTQTLIPEMDWLAEELTWRLLQMGYGDLKPETHFFAFDTSEIPALRRSNLDRTRDLVMAAGKPYITPDEARQLVGFAPLGTPEMMKPGEPYRYEMQYKPGSEQEKKENDRDS